MIQKSKTKDPTEGYAHQIALMIQLGTLPTLEQLETAILSTAAEYKPLIEAARIKNDR